MHRRLLQICALAATLLVAGGTWASAANPTPADSRAGSRAPENGKAKALNGVSELEKLKEQFALNRDSFLAERQKLIEQLKTATEAEKQKIQEQLQKQMDAMREYARQQRDDLRKQRAAAAATPPGR